MRLAKFVPVLMAVALVSCDLAPAYQPPNIVTPSAYKEATPQETAAKQPVPGDWVAAQPGDEAPRGKWWEIFGDPQLNALEDKVTENNQNLKAALAHYEGARAAIDVASADYLPTVTGDVTATRNATSANTANHAGVKRYNDFSLGASTTYEIDLWGRVRNAVSAAESAASASKSDAESVALSLHAELAADYFALRGDDSLLIVLDRTVDTDQKAFNLTQSRYKGGIAPEVDVDQAEIQLQNARTQATETRLQRAQLEHAIAVLTGQAPADFKQAAAPLPQVKLPMPYPGLPSTLLERRPDIAAAERRVAAANAEIGVARAAWFPTFSLTGAFGFESAATSGWLGAPSQFWSLGPQALLTLFDAGRIDALTTEARAAYDEAAANYRQTVLTGYQDVEDNLAALHHLTEENKSQDAATAAAERSLAQENNLYLGGAATYIDVATAQNTALAAELAAVNIRVRRINAGILLIKALGGTWQAEKQ